MAVVGNPLDGNVFVLDPLVEFGQILQAVHIPGHVVQAHLTPLRPGGVIAHLDQGDFVGIAHVGAHKGGAAGGEAVGMQAQQVGVPIPGPLGVTHKNVDVAQLSRRVTHTVLLF